MLHGAPCHTHTHDRDGDHTGTLMRLKMHLASVAQRGSPSSQVYTPLKFRKDKILYPICKLWFSKGDCSSEEEPFFHLPTDCTGRGSFQAMVTCGSESSETPRLSRYKKKLARGEIPLAGMEPQLKSEVLSTTEPEH